MPKVGALKIGLKVSVPERGIEGEIVDLRRNTDASIDANVRYSIPFARRPFYETWWPESFLQIMT